MSRGFESGSLPEHVRRLLPKDAKDALGENGLTMPEIEEKSAVKWEREIHKLIWNELLRRGIVAIHSRTDKKATIGVGIPDFCFAVGGYPIAVEVKMPSGQLTEEQEATMHQMIANGWAYYVVRSFHGFIEILSPYFASPSAEPQKSDTEA